MDILNVPKVLFLRVSLIKAALALPSELYNASTSNKAFIERTHDNLSLSDANVVSIGTTQEEFSFSKANQRIIRQYMTVSVFNDQMLDRILAQLLYTGISFFPLLSFFMDDFKGL